MNLMIDLETLGTSPRSVIVSIGAVFFDRSGVKEFFYTVLDIDQQLEDGRQAEGGTLKWWMNQSGEARQVFSESYVAPVEDAIEMFKRFVSTYPIDQLRPWGNGATFDISILEDFFKYYGHAVPWKYSAARDLRTFKDHVYDGKDIKFEGTLHNALDDATHQAKIVIEGLRRAAAPIKLAK